MSDELFEVAFSGHISSEAQLAEVKQRVGKMFNADSAKLEQLFSGRRVVIKKNIDQQTALKYQNALSRVGALCEINPMPSAVADSGAAKLPDQPEQTVVAENTVEADSSNQQTAAANENSQDVLAPPATDPLGITGDQIEDLAATIAPVGSELQDAVKEVPEPVFDLAEFDVAPVGSRLGVAKKQPDPPPPDTTGITMADD